jgi:hypothetical protein
MKEKRELALNDGDGLRFESALVTVFSVPQM